jgi:hypothetical protein
MTPANSRSSALQSKGHPPDLPSGMRYAGAHVALARSLTPGSAIRWQPMPTGYPSGPH